MPVTVVELPNSHRDSALAYLTKLTEQVRDGEVVAITCLEELNSGSYRVGGSTTMSRLQTAGALLEAAVNRLQA